MVNKPSHDLCHDFGPVKLFLAGKCLMDVIKMKNIHKN